MKKVSVSYFDAEELAAVLLNKVSEYENAEDPSEYIEEQWYEQMDYGFPEFLNTLEHLLPMIMYGQSPLTGKTYKGFGIPEDGIMLVKTSGIEK